MDNTDYALGAAHALAEDEAEFELLCPDEMEEAADVLVGDVSWLDEDLTLFLRLRDTVSAFSCFPSARRGHALLTVGTWSPSGDSSSLRQHVDTRTHRVAYWSG